MEAIKDKDFSITRICYEVPEEFLNLSVPGQGAADIYCEEKIASFGTVSEAQEALAKLRSNKISHKFDVEGLGDLIAVEQYYIADRSGKVIETALFADKPYDFRGGEIYQLYDCYGELRKNGSLR